MRLFLLDTDTCIAILRGKMEASAELDQTPLDALAISSITAYELLVGAEKGADPNTRRRTDEFLETIPTLDFDLNAARSAAHIRVYLEKKGLRIGAYDLQIAGHALAEKRTLVTHNRGEFSRVRSLKLEDWI